MILIRKAALALTFSMVLLFSVLFMSPVQAEQWSTPTPVVFSDETNIGGTISMSADGSKIAFLKSLGIQNPMGGYQEIFVVNSDGTGLKQLTSNSIELSPPSISGDGSKIVYSSIRIEKSTFPDSHGHYAEEHYSDIVIAYTDGTGRGVIASNLASSNDYGPSISADGSKVAFISNSTLFVVSHYGAGLTKLFDSATGVPSISGDGSKIAFSALVDDAEEIFVVNSDGTGLTQLTNNTVHGYDPSISGDGSKIAFISGSLNNSEIFVVNSDGTGLTQVTKNTVEDWNPTLSWNGCKLAFSSGSISLTDPLNDVFVLNLDDGELTEITSNISSAYDYMSRSDSYSVSGDADKIAFVFWIKRIFVSDLDVNSITPPQISLLSPLSQTYNESSVSLVFTVDKPVNWTGYSLDGAKNVSIAGNTTLTGLSSGLHNVTVYAEDLFGNVGASEFVVFKADLFPFVPVAAISVAVVAVVGAGLLVYFRKRKR